MKIPTQKYACVALLVVAAVVVACTGHDTAGEIEGYELAMDTVLIDTSIGGCSEDSAECARIRISYPIVTGGVPDEIRDSINSTIIAMVAPGIPGEGQASVERAVQFFLTSYEETSADFPNQMWEHNGTVDIRFQNDRMVSIRGDQYSYTGGAHPNSETRLVMLSLKDGSVLTVDDLLVDNWQPVIEPLVTEQFRAEQEIPDSLTIAEAGFWGFEDGFVMPENIGVNGMGLVFHYNAYEVGPYAAGPTEFVIPFIEIETLIDTDGPLAE